MTVPIPDMFNNVRRMRESGRLPQRFNGPFSAVNSIPHLMGRRAFPQVNAPAGGTNKPGSPTGTPSAQSPFMERPLPGPQVLPTQGGPGSLPVDPIY